MASVFYNKLTSILRTIKFSHTVFALPFGVVSFVVNVRSGELPSFYVVVFILLALVFARSLAMAFNRLVDYKYDKENPRTKDRELVRGDISRVELIVFIVLSCIGFVVSAYFINELSFYLSFVLIVLLFGYSYVKRFSFLCHFYLGFLIGFVPIAVDVALNASVSYSSVLLFLGLSSWIAGFDIIYSLLDIDFDKEAGLYSMPSYFGIRKSLFVSQLSYFVMAVSLFVFGLLNELNIIYYVGLFIIVLILFFEHLSVRSKGTVSKLLFSLNGLIAVGYLIVFLLSL